MSGHYGWGEIAKADQSAIKNSVLRDMLRGREAGMSLSVHTVTAR